jgi:hypothetical protein
MCLPVQLGLSDSNQGATGQDFDFVLVIMIQIYIRRSAGKSVAASANTEDSGNHVQDTYLMMYQVEGSLNVNSG